MKNRKARLREGFGKKPDVHYFSGDMEHIRAYFDFRRDSGRDGFLLDDITWNDLDLDRVFRRINPKRCTSGEQYLYYMLRSPAVDKESYQRRESLIRFAEKDPARRLKIETVLARLGCRRRADLCQAFYPAAHGAGKLLIYLVLLLILLGTVVWTVLSAGGSLYAVVLSVVVNVLVHELSKRGAQKEYDTVNYIVNMIFALQKLQRLHDAELDAQLAPAYESLRRLRAVTRTGGVSSAADGSGVAEIIATVTLLDLITFEFLKNKFGRCHEDVFTVHEYIGRLDAAISVASYRQSLPAYAVPELDFAPDAAGRIFARGLVHPLLEDAVPNDLETEKPILLTGSNASGKSTYLKTAALAVIMAQSICTVTAEAYSARAFRVYSSMALSDDLLAGESYYIVETKSLKRILDAAKQGEPVFCVVDEVLRGTNTVERIAASSEVLHALSEADALCLAATHDIELCDLLEGQYRLFHFEEQVGEDGMLFDYRLRSGRACTRNAINLLHLIGFDDAIVENAHARANRYLESGTWL